MKELRHACYFFFRSRRRKTQGRVQQRHNLGIILLVFRRQPAVSHQEVDEDCVRQKLRTQGTVGLELACTHQVEHRGDVEQVERLCLAVSRRKLDRIRGQRKVVDVLHLGLPPSSGCLVEVGDEAGLLRQSDDVP